MNVNKPLQCLRAVLQALLLLVTQAVKKRGAYRAGYCGQKLKGFSTLGEDSRLVDIDRVIRVHIIDRNNLASSRFIDYATIMLRPVLRAYVEGLQDGCREHGNPHIYDQCRRFQARITALKPQSGPRLEGK